MGTIIVRERSSEGFEQGISRGAVGVEDVAAISDCSVWGRVRKRLVKYFKTQGKHLDEAWFSKLTAEEVSGNNQLILKAPSNFIRDYVSREFKQAISSFVVMENYQLGELRV